MDGDAPPPSMRHMRRSMSPYPLAIKGPVGFDDAPPPTSARHMRGQHSSMQLADALRRSCTPRPASPEHGLYEDTISNGGLAAVSARNPPRPSNRHVRSQSRHKSPIASAAGAAPLMPRAMSPVSDMEPVSDCSVHSDAPSQKGRVSEALPPSNRHAVRSWLGGSVTPAASPLQGAGAALPFDACSSVVGSDFSTPGDAPLPSGRRLRQQFAWSGSQETATNSLQMES